MAGLTVFTQRGEHKAFNYRTEIDEKHRKLRLGHLTEGRLAVSTLSTPTSQIRNIPVCPKFAPFEQRGLDCPDDEFSFSEMRKETSDEETQVIVGGRGHKSRQTHLSDVRVSFKIKLSNGTHRTTLRKVRQQMYSDSRVANVFLRGSFILVWPT